LRQHWRTTPTITSASSCSPACTWQEGRLLVPGTVIAEVGYLLARNAGPRVEALFLDAVADGDFELTDLVAADARRAASLVRTYSDLPLGTTDATVVAIAERLGATEVATLDRRHFTVVRPTHVNAFTLLP
jgi:predicted nucleic acid-binding protein